MPEGQLQQPSGEETHYSKIDLKKGYHQVQINATDIPKMVITRPFGLFEFTRMTFGMRNTGNTFQRLINRTLSGIENAALYLDLRGIQQGGREPQQPTAGDIHQPSGGRLTASTEKC